MINLTEQWKKGELEVLDKLIEIIEFTEQNRALSDKYLKDNGHYAREDYDTIVGEYEYGIVFVMVDYILPYLKRVQELKEFSDYSLHNRDELTRQITFWMDKHTQIEKENQQLKAQIAKLTEIVGVLPSNHSVGNLGYKIKNQRHEINIRLNEIDKLKELLKECRDFFYENLIDTEFHFSCGLGSDIKKQSCIRSLSKLKTKIDNAMGEKK